MFDIKTNSKMILGIAIIVALLIVGWVAVDVTHQDLPNYTIIIQRLMILLTILV